MTEFSRRGTHTQSVACRKLANCRGESQKRLPRADREVRRWSMRLFRAWQRAAPFRWGEVIVKGSRCDQGSTFHISRNAGRCVRFHRLAQRCWRQVSQRFRFAPGCAELRGFAAKISQTVEATVSCSSTLSKSSSINLRGEKESRLPGPLGFYFHLPQFGCTI
jgi:hypothetical protein